MVTSTKGVSNEIPSDKLQQKELSGTGFHESISNKKGNPVQALIKKELDELQQRQSPNPEAFASQSSQDGSEFTMMVDNISSNIQLTKIPDNKDASESNQEKSSQSITPKKESDDVHQRVSPESENNILLSNKEGRSLPAITDKMFDNQNLEQSRSLDSGIQSSEFNQEGRTLSTVPEKVSYTLQQAPGPDAGVPPSESNQEKVALAIRPEKMLDKLPLRRNPESGVNALQSDQEGVTFSKLPEKPTVDGYNWRKYGQKLVRGNAFVRSYYKCTSPDCPARKQVERSHDGHITEINYLWTHEHPKPPQTLLKGTAFVLPIQARRPDEVPLTKSEDNSAVHGVQSHSRQSETTETPAPSTATASVGDVEVVVSQSSEIKSELVDNSLRESKRQKKDGSCANDTVVTKTNCEPRLVVQTTSEVDIVNDGYRWRKYGQKLVKGNPNPRSYYRCSSAGCPVKKHVERASHDQKVVITTYEGRHDHDIPAGRTVTHNTSGNTTSTTSLQSEEPRPKPEANETVSLDVVVPVSAN